MSMVFTEFTLRITPNGADLSAAEEFLEEVLEDEEAERNVSKKTGEVKLTVEECLALPYPDTVEQFAVQLAKLIPAASFIMECCHIDERCGGPCPFTITYANGSITSDAHLFDYEPTMGEEFAYNYPDYDSFCEEIQDEETGECPYSREQFEAFCNAEVLFICGSSILTEEPRARTFPVA